MTKTLAEQKKTMEKCRSFVVTREEFENDQTGKYNTKCTPAIQEIIVDAIREGLPFKLACEYAAIHHNTYLEWVKKGDREDEIFEPYHSFVIDCRVAAAEHTYSIIKKLNKVKDEQQWASWMTQLERKHPELYGRRHPTEQAPTVTLNLVLNREGPVQAIEGASAPDTIEGNKEITFQLPSP